MRDTLYSLSLLLLFMVAGLASAGLHRVYAQLPTSTPAQIRLASVTPPPAETQATSNADFVISGETAAPRNIVMLEPISEVNVRSSPEIGEDNQIGVIRAGERYPVLGQYFEWVQFQYDLAPEGRAWVYGDLVNIIGGDLSAIPTLALDATPTQDEQFVGATQTREAILAAPGGELTVTALARIVQLPDGATDGDGGVAVGAAGAPLPTYTYPPGVLVGVPTLEATRDVQASNAIDGTGQTGVPPIVPIAVLGGFGVLGIAISFLRG